MTYISHLFPPWAAEDRSDAERLLVNALMSVQELHLGSPSRYRADFQWWDFSHIKALRIHEYSVHISFYIYIHRDSQSRDLYFQWIALR